MKIGVCPYFLYFYIFHSDVAATSFDLFLTYLNGKIGYSDYFDGGTIL